MSISRLVNFFVLRTVEVDLIGNVAVKIIFRTSPCRKFTIFTFRLNITEYNTEYPKNYALLFQNCASGTWIN